MPKLKATTMLVVLLWSYISPSNAFVPPLSPVLSRQTTALGAMKKINHDDQPTRLYYKDEKPIIIDDVQQVDPTDMKDKQENPSRFEDMVQHAHDHIYKFVLPDDEPNTEDNHNKDSEQFRIKKDLLMDSGTGRMYETSNAAEDIPFATLFERTIDTIEDVVTHLRRIPYEKGWMREAEGRNDDRPTVVVLGSGWASHALTKVADTSKMKLVVVSPVNHFVFTPMLASSAVGTVEYRSMTEAVRASNPLIENYIEGKAVDIDVGNQFIKVELAALQEDVRNQTETGAPTVGNLKYDKLIVSVGAKVLDTFVPGADKFTYKLKTTDDARRLRTAIGECLEFASRPCVSDGSDAKAVSSGGEQNKKWKPTDGEEEYDHMSREERKRTRKGRLTWVIVGAGPTGVELAGELSDFIKDITRDRVGPYHRLKDEIQIKLIEGGPHVLPPFDASLRERALDKLKAQGVDVRLNTFVKEVGDGYIKVQPKDGGPIEELEHGLCVWAAGVGPVPFTETLLSKLPEEARAGRSNRINVDRWMRCPTKNPENFGSIMILGDAAAYEQHGKVLPQTAQVAAQQGAFAARLLGRGYNLSVTPPALPDDNDDEDQAMRTWLEVRGLKETPAFRFLNLGILAYLGDGKALSQINLGDKTIAKYSGSVAFVLWRSVYLVKQVATRNRVLVLFDWAKCKIFGRDTTRL